MTLQIKHKWLYIVISVMRSRKANERAVQWGRAGRCLRKLCCKERPKATKSHRKRVLSRRKSRCKGPGVGKTLFHGEKTPGTELNDQQGAD